MILAFILSLFATFAIIRFLAYNFHDMKNYGTKKEKSKTLTGYLRVKTGFDWHHFHFGWAILILIVPSIILFGINTLEIIFLAIGISMVVDQAVPIIDRTSNYFHKKNLVISLIFHIIVAAVAILLSYAQA